jgi:hypothetical protein
MRLAGIWLEFPTSSDYSILKKSSIFSKFSKKTAFSPGISGRPELRHFLHGIFSCSWPWKGRKIGIFRHIRHICRLKEALVETGIKVALCSGIILESFPSGWAARST